MNSPTITNRSFDAEINDFVTGGVVKVDLKVVCCWLEVDAVVGWISSTDFSFREEPESSAIIQSLQTGEQTADRDGVWLTDVFAIGDR